MAIEIVRIVLDVGLGTFRPISAERIDDHAMHAEAYAIPLEAAEAIERARAARTARRSRRYDRRSRAGRQRRRERRVVAGEGLTDIFISPGFRFRAVDALITNFHLPRSSLLVLVSAFAGRERILQAYAAAIERRYRFFSFGDAMFLSTSVSLT